MPSLSPSVIHAIRRAVDERRLLDTAVALIDAPSPTRSAGLAADRLAAILQREGFAVERPVADWPEAPAVVVRFASSRPGPTLQFDGHLDTVHLPFVSPRIDAGHLFGSGAADMKGGIAAAVEALRALRDTGLLPAGAILLTAHDHHEGPWGDRRQVRALIRDGYVGDAVMLPEYLADRLPVAGRGMAIFEVRITRPGVPIHEVLRPPGLPDVLGAGAALVARLAELHAQVKEIQHPYAGTDSVFVGRLHGGEIYNQAPTLCVVNGTRRWVTPGAAAAAQGQLAQILADLATQTGCTIEHDFDLQGEAFRIDPHSAMVQAFQAAHRELTGGELPLGAKPFVDDGNSFAGLAGIPALTHGPAGTGAHTVDERVAVSELVRVAQVYALTAIAFCTA